MRKSGMTARVAAVVLAASMVMTSVLPTFAAENLTVETDDKAAVDGVSKVIGLRGEADWNVLAGGTAYETPYSYVNKDSDSVYVAGTKETLETMKFGDELYKNGDNYYPGARMVTPSVIRLSGPATIVVDGLQPDPTTGLYVVNGKYYAYVNSTDQVQKDAQGNITGYTHLASYVSDNNEVNVLGTVPGEFEDDYYYAGDMQTAVDAAFGRKLDAARIGYDCYAGTDGKLYKTITNVRTATNPETGKYVVKSVYSYKTNEIALDKRYQQISWNEVTNKTEVDSNGKLLYVGYQIKMNDVDVVSGNVASNNGSLQTIYRGTTYTTPIGYTAAEKNKFEVRAVYYTATQNYVAAVDEETQQPYESNEGTTYEIVKTGAWSEPFTYAWSMPSVPAVANLQFVQKSVGKGELSWNAAKEAHGYKVEYVSSNTLVDPAAYGELFEDANSVRVGANTTHYDVTNRATNNYEYTYYRVCAYVETEDTRLYGDYSNVVAVGLDKRENTPEIKNLQIEQKMDGSFDLTWDEIDKNAEVVVYASQDKKMFNTPEFTYRQLNATGKDAAGKEYRLTEVFGLQDKLAIIDKKVESYTGTGIDRVSSTQLDLEVGKKYYFVVATVDSINRGTDRSAAGKYIANVAKVPGAVNNVSFGYYNDIVTSKTVSATPAINITQPSTKSGKTTVTMYFNKTENVTGYQIYRKNSKGKFKKIATINSAQYADKELKENTIYDYQVRGYYYNPDTKKTAYSDYVYFSAETGNDKFIELNVNKQSKNSVKLKWTKVSGVTQYEIYRSYMTGTSTNYTQKNNSGYGYGDGAYALSNAKWEKIKTITNAKTTSFTDKKLKKGTSYTYRIVATYASGAATRQVWASDSVVMKATAPQDVKLTLSKNNVKVTWDKDTYASKYQIRYKKYDAENRAEKLTWTVKSTKKNYYTIKNIAKGGKVEVQVRAYGDKKWSVYTGTYTKANGELAAAKNVTAKEVTETLADGKTKTTAVKVTWKKVSGAAYYKVFRSTSPVADYNADNKTYYRPDDDNFTLISKESNADETYDNVFYKDYKNVSGSVVGTKATDRARLQTGVTYYYYVAAYSENGTRISKGFNKPASICYKATPVISKVTIKKGKVTLKVAKVTGAKQYEIYRSTKKNKGYEKIGVTKKNKTTYVDKTVKKGKTYYYKVVAVGTNGLKGDFVSSASAAKKVKAK